MTNTLTTLQEKAVKFCSCGNPQSYPIPHEHDQTDREKQIIKHLEQAITDSFNKGVEEVLDEVERIVHEMPVVIVDTKYNPYDDPKYEHALLYKDIKSKLATMRKERGYRYGIY